MSIMHATSAVSAAGSASEIGMIGGKTYARFIVGPTAVQALNLVSNGELTESGSAGTPTGSVPGDGEWHIRNPEAGVGDDWEVRATLTAGALTSGNTGVWERLNLTRTWTRNSGVTPALTATLTFEFRRFGTTFIVKTVPNVVLSAEATPI